MICQASWTGRLSILEPVFSFFLTKLTEGATGWMQRWTLLYIVFSPAYFSRVYFLIPIWATMERVIIAVHKRKPCRRWSPLQSSNRPTRSVSSLKTWAHSGIIFTFGQLLWWFWSLGVRAFMYFLNILCWMVAVGKVSTRGGGLWCRGCVTNVRS